MNFGKVFQIFKKGAKATGGTKRGAKGEVASAWPEGIRIGVFGQANSGKTVYFTVLNEESKISRDLQISVTDTSTAGELLSHYRSIWGIGSSHSTGTVVDLREEKKFPEPTSAVRVLQFNAILDRDKKLPVVTLEYDGKAVDINETHPETQKVLDFMAGCDGLLFFYDPKILGAELTTQAYAAAYAAMIERLAPLNRRLPIPCALVVTKADILPGFSSEDQTVLVKGEDESFLADDFESFLEHVLSSNRIAADSTWAGTVRGILVKMKEFLKVAVGRTLNFQIFFTSCTGAPPKKIGTDVGRSLYAPPDKMQPIGVKEPFYWVLKAIVRNRRIDALRAVTRWVAVLSLSWIVLYSLPNLYHFNFLLDRTLNVENDVLHSYKGMVANTSQQDRSRVKNAYQRYESSWMVRNMYTRFQAPARQLRVYYEKFNIDEAVRGLDTVINRMTAIVRNPTLWPMVHPASDSLELTPEHVKLEADLQGYHQGDESSVLYTRSGRVLDLWRLFKQVALRPSDTTNLALVVQQVNHDAELYGADRSKAEIELGQALTAAAEVKKETTAHTSNVQQAGGEFDALVAEIGAHEDAEYRLKTAVKKLRDLRNLLKDNPSRAEDVAKIDTYLSQAKYFDEPHQFTFTTTSLPDGHHMHMLVKRSGRDEKWQPGKQLLKGREYSITWKSGDVIVISLHENHKNPADESWGEKYKSQVTFKDPYAIFKLTGPVDFQSGERAGFTFEDDPRDHLPEF